VLHADEDDIPAVFDRYSNSFIKIYFDSPKGREDEIASKERHCKFPQPELGPWVAGSRTVGSRYQPTVLEGWESPDH
jgi:hypothetical protein